MDGATLILGASSDEPHVKNYVLEHAHVLNKVVCVSTGRLKGRRTGDAHSFYNGVLLVNEYWDFNDIGCWKRVKQKYTSFNSIIVDWSTAKYFHSGINIITGEVFRLIISLLLSSPGKGEFVCPIESNLSICVTNVEVPHRSHNVNLVCDFHKRDTTKNSRSNCYVELPPGFQYMAVTPPPLISQNIKCDPNAVQYTDFVRFYSPVEFHSNIRTCSPVNSYPLRNSNIKLPYRYLHLEKKNKIVL